MTTLLHATRLGAASRRAGEGARRAGTGLGRRTTAVAVVCLWAATAQEAGIESLSRNGVITWTNAHAGAACRVEWAPTVQGPWSASWTELTDIRITNLVTERAVPMFYRVLSYPPPTPVVTDVTVETALQLMGGHAGDPEFLVLDVRTPGEYATARIRTALNVNFYSAAFEETLAKLDRKKVYLLYCASGNRSRQAADVMRRLEFLQVNNMTGGFGAFAALTGAAAYVER